MNFPSFLPAFYYYIALPRVKAVQHTSRSRSFFMGKTALRCYAVHITANVCVKSQVFHCTRACRFINGCECFEGVCCLHLQGSLRNVSCTGTFVIWGGNRQGGGGVSATCPTK